MSGATISDMSPVEQVRVLLGLTETNGGLDLVPEEEIEDAISMYPQNLKYAAANIALSLANAAAIDADPQSFALQGVMSMSFQDPAAHWRSVYRFLLEQGEREYERQRELDAPHFSAIVHRDQVEDELEYSKMRKMGGQL